MQLPSLYDYEVSGYHVDDKAHTIRFILAPPKGSPNARESVEIVFGDVEGYFLEHDLGTSIVFAVEEQPLLPFLFRNEEHFVHEAQWGWPLFWQGSAQGTASWLTSRGRRVWAISSSYGMSGWVVAGAVTFRNGHG